MIILLLSNSKNGQMISTVKVMEYYDETNEWRLCIVQINGTGLPPGAEPGIPNERGQAAIWRGPKTN